MKKAEIIVIGAGAAGLMAAGQAAECGARTLLLEKMPRPARKLKISGKGRCNLTNVLPLSEFIGHISPDGRFLRQVFAQFFCDELRTFFDKLGVPTKVERGGRVFPQSDRAVDIVDALVGWVKKSGVMLTAATRIDRLTIENHQVCGVRTESRRYFQADAVILATGGSTYPLTGSTGDGYQMARAAGHRITSIRPGLVPLETAGNIASKLDGLNLRHVALRVKTQGKDRMELFGDLSFTIFGLTGPIVLTASRRIVDWLHQGEKVVVSIDLKPALNPKKLDARLLRDLDQYGKKPFESILKGLLPARLIPVCLQLTEIPPKKPAHQITAEERRRLRIWLKDFQLQITGHRPIEEAIITAGGVDLKEVDPRSMASKKVKGLYFAGEVLDLDADTGGYNLQTAFSTGWLAGRSAAKRFRPEETG
jgi:predicted Rossmann fold flavoprotein